MQQPQPAQGRILEFLQKDPEDTLWYSKDLVKAMNVVKKSSESELNERSITRHLRRLVEEGLAEEEFETPEEQQQRIGTKHYRRRIKKFKISAKGRRSKSTAKKIIAKNKKVPLTSAELRDYFGT